ncbi:MAG TPA: hypothetical protein PLZ55_09005, partial [bacterium]|nr:hypothetical protein [bacterium]
MSSVTAIQSEGDLEVVLLHETHSLLAELIGPDLYSVHGDEPEQSVLFHTRATLNLFLILVVEIFAEGPRSACINQKYQNWSLLKGLHWFCDRYTDEAKSAGLHDTLSAIETWAAKDVPFSFWCPDVDKNISFSLKNDQLISFAANTAKHHLFRLTDLLGKLESLCVNAGYSFTPQQFSAVLASMTEEVRSRMQYHSSYLVELLGNLFLALNRLVVTRSRQNPTDLLIEINMPAGITSDVFRHLYASVMVFK